VILLSTTTLWAGREFVAQSGQETATDEMLHRQLTEEELLRALTSEAQRRAEPQPEDPGDYEE